MKKLTNVGLAAYALTHAKKKTKYVMGTCCRVLTTAKLESLIKANPGNWFTQNRVKEVRTWIGEVTTDCHGLIEGYCNDYDSDFVVEQGEGTFDTYADGAYSQATVKGPIYTIDKSMIGLCVRFTGHVGVYIGNGLVAEARGFDHGTCITELSERQWTDWYQHPMVSYSPVDSMPVKDITKNSSLKDILWLQWRLGVVTDGEYGPKTAAAYLEFARKRKWTKVSGNYVGMNGRKALSVA